MDPFVVHLSGRSGGEAQVRTASSISLQLLDLGAGHAGVLSFPLKNEQQAIKEES